jgi:hypothetical protein
MRASRLLALYPQNWRRRYGEEIAYMLREKRLSVSLVVDLVRGASDAHLHPELAGPLLAAAGGGTIQVPLGGGSMTKLRRLHAVLGLLCLAFVALIVVANTVLHTAPGGLGYFKRGDVAAMLGLATVLAVVLFWASAGDTDRHRAIGSIASGTMAGLLLGTVSIPVLAVPLSVIGCFRLPDSRAARAALLLLVPLGAVVGVALPNLGRSLIAP